MKDDINDLMMSLIGKIYELDMPLLIKGAYATLAILSENNYNYDDMNRATVDIDIGLLEKLSINDVIKEIEKAIQEIDKNTLVKMTREPKDNITAKLEILDKNTNNFLFSIDINMKEINEYRLYKIGEIEFKGVLPESIISDKISVLSSDKIFRRAKDFVDIYSYSKCINIDTNTINKALKESNKNLKILIPLKLKKKILNMPIINLKELKIKYLLKRYMNRLTNF